MDKADLYMLWVMYMKVNGKTTWQMDLDAILIVKAPNMREISLRICSMAMEKSHGKMEHCIKVITKPVEEMAMENLCSRINLNTRAILSMIISMARELMIGPMVENTKDNGL